MDEKRLKRFADVLIWGLKTARKGRFKRNDIVMISYDPPSTPLLETVYSRCIEMGMNVVIRGGITFKMEREFYKKAKNPQLTFIAPGEEELYRKLNGIIHLRSPASLTHLMDVDPKRIGKVMVSRKRLRDIIERREEEGHFGWTLCIYPTKALAKMARIPLKRYEELISKACFLDMDDPVSEWKKIYKRSQKIKRWLNSLDIEYLHIRSKNIDLRVYPGERRKWVGISGHNIPSFELFISPDFRKTEGIYFADQPSFRNGNYVEGVWLQFKGGRVIEARAEKGDDFLKKQISIDRGAKRVGEFSLTDKRFSKIDRFMANTLFDENYGGKYGNCHLALGMSYSDTYSGNPKELTKEKKKELGFNDSALHWDLINTERKTVTAYLRSGKELIIYKNGEFMIDL